MTGSWCSATKFERLGKNALVRGNDARPVCQINHRCTYIGNWGFRFCAGRETALPTLVPIRSFAFYTRALVQYCERPTPFLRRRNYAPDLTCKRECSYQTRPVSFVEIFTFPRTDDNCRKLRQPFDKFFLAFQNLSVLSRNDRLQSGHWPPAPHDRDAFASLHLAKEFGKMPVGFGRCDRFGHGNDVVQITTLRKRSASTLA